MAYKLSERHLQDERSIKNNDPNRFRYGPLVIVFMLFSMLSFITAFYYSAEQKVILNTSYYPENDQSAQLFGPLIVKKYNEAYNISVRARVPMNSWSFVEGQILDKNKVYLFSFGKELWKENGHDSEGYWVETVNDYSMNVTFPKPGEYYLKFQTESKSKPPSLSVKVVRKKGSSIPLIWLGVLTLLIGLVLNHIRASKKQKLLK